jgi:E3 ubiquitin-protein ligase TRIP12
MNRPQPVSNKILFKKWEENNKRIHQEKLKNMQARVNSGKPAQFFHLKFKAKRDQMLEDRFTEIERENRILLEKMSSIMNKKHSKDSSNEVKSLNTKARRLEMRRIAIENQALLKRLQDRSPCYNTQQWEEERKKTERRLKNICEFPYIGVRDKSTPAQFKKPHKLSPIGKQGIFKKGVAIGERHFVVEIRKNKRHLVVYLNDVESPDSYSLQIPIKEAIEIMGGSFNYDLLVRMLEMENGEVVLVDQRDSRRNGESAPARYDPRFNVSAGFAAKPKTNHEKTAKSHDFQEKDKLGKTDYESFHISARASKEEDDSRHSKNLSFKVDDSSKGAIGTSKPNKEIKQESDQDDDMFEEESSEHLEKNALTSNPNTKNTEKSPEKKESLEKKESPEKKESLEKKESPEDEDEDEQEDYEQEDYEQEDDYESFHENSKSPDFDSSLKDLSNPKQHPEILSGSENDSPDNPNDSLSIDKSATLLNSGHLEDN